MNALHREGVFFMAKPNNINSSEFLKDRLKKATLIALLITCFNTEGFLKGAAIGLFVVLMYEWRRND